jgi:hypothetical protein
MADELKSVKRQLRDTRRHLRDLVNAAGLAIVTLDDEMKKPSTEQRGRNVAKICNYLEMQNDSAAHFGLGLPLRKKSLRP